MSEMKASLSLKKICLRSQVSVSYALMAILPILTMGYLVWTYVDPEILSQHTLVIVVFLTVVISLFGFFLLRQVIDALSDFRNHLKTIVEDRVLDAPLNSDESSQGPPPAESLEETVLGLIKHNSKLSDMFSDMEELNWSKTRELTRVNLELQRQLKKGKDVEDQLRKSNMQLSDALTKLKELQQRISQHQRLSALRDLANQIAHDLNNALMPVVGFAELITTDEALAANTQKVKAMGAQILQGARDAAAIVAKLRNFYQQENNPTPQLRPLKILMIDDDRNTRDAVASMLRPDGHEVTLAATAAAGVDLARNSTFDIIITDRAMPDSSGEEVARKIREAKPELPIIMATGFADMMQEQKENPFGVDTLISKPVNPKTLKCAIADLVDLPQKPKL